MTTVVPQRLTLSEDELLAVADRLGVRDLPTVLTVRNRHTSVNARNMAREQAARNLLSRRLIVAGDVHPELDAALQALHRPERELAMRLVTPDGTVRVSVARRGSLCVLARRCGAQVTLHTVGRDTGIHEVSSALLAELPASRPAETEPVGAPLLELAEALSGTHEYRELADRIRAAGAQPRSALLLGAALATREAFAEIVYHARCNEDGRIRRGPGAVGVFYTEKGRIVGAPSKSPAGQLWVTLKPGSDHVFVQAVGQLIEAGEYQWEEATSQKFDFA